MSYYITVDAGGTKCNAVLFDDAMHIVGRGLSGGVNTTQNSPEAVKANVAECLDKLFADVCPQEIEVIYLSFVGNTEVLLSDLGQRTSVKNVVNVGEAKAGILAGMARPYGMLAIAGTGSDVFYLAPEKAANRRNTCGGWGSILGDQGSGTWMGQQALQAIIKGVDGWGPATVLRELVMEAHGMTHEWDLVSWVHGSPSPFRTVASVTPLIGKAVTLGDQVARDIVLQAADLMAQQTLCILNRGHVPDEDKVLVVCGGAWKVHPLMYETYKSIMNREYPDVEIMKPLFEHVMVGPVKQLLDSGVSREETIRIVSQNFSDYLIRW